MFWDNVVCIRYFANVINRKADKALCAVVILAKNEKDKVL